MARIFHPIAQTTECVVRYLLDGKPCSNVFHYQWNNTTPPTPAELASLVNEVEATIAVKLKSLLANAFTYTETYARNMHVQVADQAVINSSLSGVPRNGDPSSNGTACWLTKRTGHTGYGQHGGVNISGFSDLDTVRNTLSQALINLLINLTLSFLANRVGGRFIPALGSRTHNVSYLMRSMAMIDPHTGSAKGRNLA